jgi:hypothetical protein
MGNISLGESRGGSSKAGRGGDDKLGEHLRREKRTLSNLSNNQYYTM